MKIDNNLNYSLPIFKSNAGPVDHHSRLMWKKPSIDYIGLIEFSDTSLLVVQ